VDHLRWSHSPLWNRAGDTSRGSREQLSALLSLVAAAVIVGATYFQWWDVSYGGGLPIAEVGEVPPPAGRPRPARGCGCAARGRSLLTLEPSGSIGQQALASCPQSGSMNQWNASCSPASLHISSLDGANGMKSEYSPGCTQMGKVVRRSSGVGLYSGL
jgi:hypothetical protein